jgi:hypothetical protein
MEQHLEVVRTLDLFTEGSVSRPSSRKLEHFFTIGKLEAVVLWTIGLVANQMEWVAGLLGRWTFSAVTDDKGMSQTDACGDTEFPHFRFGNGSESICVV